MRFALALIIAAASPAGAGWTFCVAEAGPDVWISEVFAAARKREALEAQFAASLRARGVAHPDAQCPEPQGDKTEVFNAQFTAAEFHRKLGQTLHAAAAPARR
jgi:NAD-dependent oxidoreductase involved in siderophore biosynthesis